MKEKLDKKSADLILLGKEGLRNDIGRKTNIPHTFISSIPVSIPESNIDEESENNKYVSYKKERNEKKAEMDDYSKEKDFQIMRSKTR